MCFIYDYDWLAEYSKETTYPATHPTTCQECHRIIAVGQPVHHLYQQQYECCRLCDEYTREIADMDYDGSPLTPCQDGQCDHGETFDYNCCDDCHLFLHAVETSEIAAGCRPSESRPLLQELLENLVEIGARDCLRYFHTAAKLHPSLLHNDYLTWLYRKCYGDD